MIREEWEDLSMYWLLQKGIELIVLYVRKVYSCEKNYLSSRVNIRIGFLDYAFKMMEVKQVMMEMELKYGFHNKSFILNAPLVSCPISVICFGWVQQQTHPKQMTGIEQLTRGAFRINELLWNPYFSSSPLRRACFAQNSSFWTF